MAKSTEELCQVIEDIEEVTKVNIVEYEEGIIIMIHLTKWGKIKHILSSKFRTYLDMRIGVICSRIPSELNYKKFISI